MRIAILFFLTAGLLWLTWPARVQEDAIPHAVDALNEQFIIIDLDTGIADFLPMTIGGIPYDAGSVLLSLGSASDGALHVGFRRNPTLTSTTFDPDTGVRRLSGGKRPGEVFGLETDLLGELAGAENLAFAVEGELLHGLRVE